MRRIVDRAGRRGIRFPGRFPTPPRADGDRALTGSRGTVTATDAQTTNPPQRRAQVIRLRPDHAEEYLRLHAAVWPEVLDAITACNIRNYSIYLHGDLLMSYFEYVGADYEADAAKMAADP